MGLLIASWGCPWSDPCGLSKGFSWKEVTYVWGERRVRSRTSLPLLLKTLEPRAALILVCDTVACVNDFSEGRRYEDLINAVKGKYEGFIDAVLSDAGLAGYRGRVEVAVIPCFGTFRNGEFRTRAEDTRSWILYTLLKFLVRNLTSAGGVGIDGDVTVTLDLTHGVNYLPTITYASLKSLLHHLAFISRGSGKEVRLQVLNSDPFTSPKPPVEEAAKEVRINVNVIEETTIHPSTELHPLNDGVSLKFRLCRRNQGSGELIETSKKLRERYARMQEQLNNLLYFYASVHAGMPLATLTFMNELDLSNLMKGVEEYFKDHLRNGFEVSTDAGRVRVTETLCLASQVSFILKAVALLTAIRESLRGRGAGTKPTLRNLSTAAEIIAWNQTLKEMTANELHNIKETICEYLLSPNKEEIAEKLSERIPGTEAIEAIVAKTIKECIKKCVENLGKLEGGVDLREMAVATGRKVKNFSPRNFLAHAGLEYNTIRVEATVKLTYRKEEKKLMEECKKTLKKQVTLPK